jgi:hypothetical protein
MLLVPQRFDRIQLVRAAGRIEAEEDADGCGEEEREKGRDMD